MATRYFQKEIITNPFYLPTGAPLKFQKNKGQIGVIAIDDDAVSAFLQEASRKRMGGIVEIEESAYREAMGDAVVALDVADAVASVNGHFHTWNGRERTEPNLVTPPIFYHSGDLGDIIYAMPTIKELGGGIVHLGPDNRTTMPTREAMTLQRCNLIAPLIAAQSYVHRVEFSGVMPCPIDYDLNQFRKEIIGRHGDIAPGMNLARVQLKHFGQRLEADQQPWITVDTPTVLGGKCVVLARTRRYHNPRFNWREIVRRYGAQSVFVGTELEWNEFCREFGPVDYHKCQDLLDVARIIASAKLFVGNQSCPYAIAEGLKQNAILEVAPQAPNCMFARPNAWAVWKTPFQLPDLGSLVNAVYAKRDIAFDEDYFMRGQETGVSNYTNYSWMPDVTPVLAKSIRDYLGIEKPETVLDFGCSRGYLVRAFREMDISAFGCDISEWAINHCDETVVSHVFTPEKFTGDYDWIVAKDVLEHIPSAALESTVKNLLNKSRLGLFIVVPLSGMDGGEFICPRDNQDVTHVTRWTLGTWLKFLRRADPGFIYHGSFHVPGIKQASEPYEASCGFITAKRIG